MVSSRPLAGVQPYVQEAASYTLSAGSPLHIDVIIIKSALTVRDVSAILLRLEIKEAIMQLPGKFCHLMKRPLLRKLCVTLRNLLCGQPAVRLHGIARLP
jgi:hypothetical protein